MSVLATILAAVSAEQRQATAAALWESDAFFLAVRTADAELVQAAITLLLLLVAHNNGLLRFLVSTPAAAPFGSTEARSFLAQNGAASKHCLTLVLFAVLSAAPSLVPATITLLTEVAGAMTEAIADLAHEHFGSACPCRRQVQMCWLCCHKSNLGLWGSSGMNGGFFFYKLGDFLALCLESELASLEATPSSELASKLGRVFLYQFFLPILYVN